MENERKQWIDAATKLIQNPAEKVLCPNCENAYLDVKDVFLDYENPEMGIERYLLCTNCEKQEAILLHNNNQNYGIIQNNNIWFKKSSN
jgi:hypothetical protein